MRANTRTRVWLSIVCAGLLAAVASPTPATAAAPEPDFFLIPNFVVPPPKPPPPKPPDLQGSCGAAVSSTGHFYLSNYYSHTIDIFRTNTDFVTSLTNVDPLDGPCGLGLDSAGKLYINNYHRNIEKFTPSVFPPTESSTFTAAGVIDSSHPTGVAVDIGTGNVYVDDRTHVAVYGPTGTPLQQIGEGSLGEGYGLAVSAYPGTSGWVYVPDHEDDTVKVYDPNVSTNIPIDTISGPPGGFGSLRDSAVAVDRVTGEVYVADTLAYPQYTEHPLAVIHVFGAGGLYEGRLKYTIVDGSPPGLAVDNSVTPSQGRVYVTSGNAEWAGVYGYPPGSATNEGGPAAFSLSLSTAGSGAGAIANRVVGTECAGTCEEEVRAGAQISLTAEPSDGSVFTGWSGAGCSGTGPCSVQMSEAQAVSAEFTAPAGPPAPVVGADGGQAGTPPRASAERDAAVPGSVLAQSGTLRVAVSGRLAPSRLPRKGTAPTSVSVGGEITTTDGSLPPPLKVLRVELNRHGSLDYAGLPTCPYNRIQPGSSAHALASCRAALVGKGTFSANITIAGQESYATGGRLLVFNGVQRGKPVLFGHIYARRPFATSFVIVFHVEELSKGPYGIALDAPLPKAMDAWGRLSGIEMNLSRRYSYGRKRHSYISAGCPAPQGFSTVVFPLARTSFSFGGGKRLSVVLSSACRTRS